MTLGPASTIPATAGSSCGSGPAGSGDAGESSSDFSSLAASAASLRSSAGALQIVHLGGFEVAGSSLASLSSPGWTSFEIAKLVRTRPGSPTKGLARLELGLDDLRAEIHSSPTRRTPGGTRRRVPSHTRGRPSSPHDLGRGATRRTRNSVEFLRRALTVELGQSSATMRNPESAGSVAYWALFPSRVHKALQVLQGLEPCTSIHKPLPVDISHDDLYIFTLHVMGMMLQVGRTRLTRQKAVNKATRSCQHSMHWVSARPW